MPFGWKIKKKEKKEKIEKEKTKELIRLQPKERDAQAEWSEKDGASGDRVKTNISDANFATKELGKDFNENNGADEEINENEPFSQNQGPQQGEPPPPYRAIQIGAEWWMETPPVQNSDCPPGLEYFSLLQMFVVKQRIEVLELVLGCEQANKYDVFNQYGQHIYKAKELSPCCHRQFCDMKREFNMEFVDGFNNEVIHFYRPYRPMCCNVACLQEMCIEAPVGDMIGLLLQIPHPCRTIYEVYTPPHNLVAKVYCPLPCECHCFRDTPFPVYDLQGTEIAIINRKFTVKGYFTDADNFTIMFHQLLSVQLKATLMGALFLIDFMFYEQSGNNGGGGNNNGGGVGNQNAWLLTL